MTNHKKNNSVVSNSVKSKDTYKYHSDFTFDTEYTLTTSLKEYEKKILQLENDLSQRDKTISELNAKISILQSEVTQLSDMLNNINNNSTNITYKSEYKEDDISTMIELKDIYNHDYKTDAIYYDDNIMSSATSKQSMNDGISVLMINTDCPEGNKIASTSLYNLNKFYPVIKVYLSNSTDSNASSIIERTLPRIETKYTLIVDGSVEFSLNTHLKRLLRLLQSGEAVIAGGMEEDENGILTTRCYDLYIHNNILEHREGYSGVFSGNCMQCERIGHHFLINTDILRNLWPTDIQVPYKLAIESLFIDAKRYGFPVASCPVSIFRYKKHQQCNPNTVSWKLIDEQSKMRFAHKYKLQVIQDIDGDIDILPLYVERQTSPAHYESPYLYQSMHSLIYTSKKILNKYHIPFVFTGKELIGGLSIGAPVPWDNHLQITALSLITAPENTTCDIIDIKSPVNQYMLNSLKLKGHKAKRVCLSISPSLLIENEEDQTDEEIRNKIKTKDTLQPPFTDIDITFPTNPRQLYDYLLPLKILKIMNEYVFVPNNPVLYLERENREATEASTKDVELFRSSKAEDEDHIWPMCTSDNDEDLFKDICIQSTYEASDYILHKILSYTKN